MRIVILGTAYPYRGGLAAFNERLAEAFVEAGHWVHVVTFTLQYPDFLFPGESQLDVRPAPAGFGVSRKLNSVNPVSYVTTGRYIRSLRPDLIVCKFWLPFMGPALGTALRYAKRDGARVLSIVDNIVPHESRPGDRAFARYFAGAVDDFVVMSRSVQADMVGFAQAPQRVEYHAHPIYDNFGEGVGKAEACAALGLDAEVEYVLFFGFIRDYKGLDLLLEAWAAVLQTNGLQDQDAPALRLLVAGEYYGNREKYESLISALGLEEHVVLHTHFIPNDAVRYYFSVASLVAQPYKTATQSGISQMAYHFGVPMVVTHVGGLPEIVPDGEAGFVVAVDAGAIATAIERFFALSVEEREGFRQNVRRLARAYGWPEFVDALLRLIPQADASAVARHPTDS